jgi:polyvinyl alcohol dehydrogenase (cytochrome)
MKLTSAIILGLGLAAAPAAFAGPAVSDGESLFAARCNMCHGSGMGGAPLTEKLAALDPKAVVEKLTGGTMAPMAAGISDENKRDIAVFLTKKPLAAEGGLPEVKP